MATATPPDAIAEDALYEVVDGQVVEKPMRTYEVWVASRLVRLMNRSNVVNELGQVVSELLFLVDAARDLKRRPDVAFISFERWPSDTPVPDVEAWDVMPDLAVELISRSNTAIDVRTKLHEYFKAGVRAVWVIYPKSGEIDVYESPTSIRTLRRDDTLDGAPVLPGFILPLAHLFGTTAE